MNNTHSILVGYVLWIFGFMGAHRFYYGKPVTGTIWLCTFGLLGIGWLVDLFLIPSMDAAADRRYKEGVYNYSLAWILLTFLGIFGAHRLYLGKWLSALAFLIITLLCTTAVFFIMFLPIVIIGLPLVVLCIVYDFWTLNGQIDTLNRAWPGNR